MGGLIMSDSPDTAEGMGVFTPWFEQLGHLSSSYGMVEIRLRELFCDLAASNRVHVVAERLTPAQLIDHCKSLAKERTSTPRSRVGSPWRYPPPAELVPSARDC